MQKYFSIIYINFSIMDSETARDLVTIASFGKETVGSGSEVKSYSMTEKPIDYEAEWGQLG